MKNKILILCVALIGLSLQTMAQSPLVSRYKLQLDTVTNTATKNLTSPRVAGTQQTVTVTASIPAIISGTQGGVMRLYGSTDGVVYTRIRATDMKGAAPVDSLIITTGPDNQAKSWVIDHSPFQYYQPRITGSGTTAFTIKGNIVAH